MCRTASNGTRLCSVSLTSEPNFRVRPAILAILICIALRNHFTTLTPRLRIAQIAGLIPSFSDTVLSRIASPTILLYSVVLITQIARGIYLGEQIEPPGAFTLLYWLAFLWIIGWWLRTDSRKRGVASVYDMGFFLYIGWPLVMTYYLVKTRGAKGLLVVLGLVGAYAGAAIIGITLSLLVAGFGG